MMSLSDDMQDLFDPVIQDITQLVGQQVRDAKRNNASKIDVIPCQLAKILETMLTFTSSALSWLGDLANRHTYSRSLGNGVDEMEESR
jgi:hypothetical protein